MSVNTFVSTQRDTVTAVTQSNPEPEPPQLSKPRSKLILPNKDEDRDSSSQLLNSSPLGLNLRKKMQPFPVIRERRIGTAHAFLIFSATADPPMMGLPWCGVMAKIVENGSMHISCINSNIEKANKWFCKNCK